MTDTIEYVLTMRERDQAFIDTLVLESLRRERNEADQAKLEAAQRGNAARLGVVCAEAGA